MLITINKSIIIGEDVKVYVSVQAALAVLGRKVCEVQSFEPISEQVKIAQKTVKITPIE